MNKLGIHSLARALARALGLAPLLVLVLVLGLGLAGCAGLTKPWSAPEVTVTSLQPQKIGLDEQSLLVGLQIHNPNDRMLPIKAMSYRLTLEGDEIASGSGKLERQIPAFGDASAEVSVTGSALGLAGKLPAMLLTARPWQYQIAGTVTVAGVVPIPYRYSGELDPKALLRAGPLR
jgi:hypothetical protein